MANNVEINLKAKTTDFETGLDKAIKSLETFGKKGGEADKAMTTALKHINESAKNNIDELQQNMARFNVKSDLRINVNLDVLNKAKEGVTALFNKIESGGASIAETTAALNNMNAQMANLNSHQTRGQFKDLGILSEASIEAMKVKAISAFAEIERSGVATPNDIIRAHEAMTAKIAELNALTVTNAEKTAAAKINIAHEEALAEIRTYEEAASMNQKFEYEKQRAAEKTAAAKILMLKEVAAAERASYAAQGMSGSGAAAGLIGQPLAGSGFTNNLRAQMEAEAQAAQLRSREMASYAASAMQGEAAAARLAGNIHAGSDFTAQLKAKMEETVEGTKKVNEGISGWSLASVAAIAKIQIMYSLINNMMSAISSMPGMAIDAIENYKGSIISNAAVITSMQGKVKDVGAAYRENKVYAEALEKVLIKMDADTSASYAQLQLMNTAFISQGAILDINNKKAVEGYKSVAQAISVIAKMSSNPDQQFTQEAKSLFSGEMRAGNQLLNILAGIDPKIKEHIALWRQEGTVFENLAPLLQGYAAAQGDIDNMWQTVKSTMGTIRDEVLRGGLSEGFQEIINAMKDLSKYATENKDKMQAFFRDAFKDIKSIVTTMWEFRDSIKAGAEIALWAGIAMGIASVITKLEAMYKSIIAINLATGSGFLPKLLALGGGAVAGIGGMATGTFILGKGLFDVESAQKEGDLIAKHLGESLEKYALSGQAMQWLRKQKPMATDMELQKMLQSGVFKAIPRESRGEDDSPYDMYNPYSLTYDAKREAELNKAGSPIAVPKVNIRKEGSENNDAYNEAVRDYNALIKIMDEWELKGVKAGKVEDSLAASVEAVNVQIKNQIAQHEKANMFSDTKEMTDYIKAQGERVKLDLIAADAKKGQAEIDKAQNAANMSDFKTKLATEEASLKESYSEKLISTKEYYAKMDDIIKSNSDIIINQQEKVVEDAIDAYNKLIDDGVISEAMFGAAEAKIIQEQALLRKLEAEASTKLSNNSSTGIKAENKDEADKQKLAISEAILNAQEKITNLEFESKMGNIFNNELLKEKLNTESQLLNYMERQYALIPAGEEGDKRRLALQKLTNAEQKKFLDVQKQIFDTTALGGFTNAWRKYAEDASNMGKQIEGVTTRAFKGMEDALVSFVQTGKINFKTLADSMIADIIRIGVQLAMSNAMKAIFGSMSGGGFESGLSGLSTAGTSGIGLTGASLSGGASVLKAAATTAPAPTFAARQAVSGATGGKGGEAGNTTFILQNNTGTQMKAKEGNSSFDGKNMVKLIILEAMDTDPGFKYAMRGA